MVAIGLSSAGSGCTLAKPIVGVFTGPAVILGHCDGDWGGNWGDGRAVVAVFAVMAAIGAVGGLVTGVISDVHVLCGNVREPCRNWADPFKTNRDG
jgi:hypothetical protein